MLGRIHSTNSTFSDCMQQLRSLAVLLKLVLNTCWVNETKDFKDATGEDKYNSLSISAAYEYPLSKRTTLWGFASWADGSSSKLKDLKKADSSLKTANYDGYVLSVGMTHNF